MDKELMQIYQKVQIEIEKAENEQELTAIYLKIFGKNGSFTQLLKKIKLLTPNSRPVIGQLINKLKGEIEARLKHKQKKLIQNSLAQSIDVTAPGLNPPLGHLHIVTQTIAEVTGIFERIGFTRRRYPEIEWEWYSFESLNMPVNHPARDDFETFFLNLPPNPKLGKIVLSPHTSSGQVREMERVGTPPIRMINIAKCYRPNWDISHTPMFHQFEGLVIDKGINITHLKGTFEYFAREFFGKDRKIRLRPFHFQFTEPSFEVDITCGFCKGEGCRLCKEGWMELCGSGMVHPNVLKAGNIDPKIYSGYAFGWGIERSYIMKQGMKINDLRLIYNNDIRFIEQF